MAVTDDFVIRRSTKPIARNVRPKPRRATPRRVSVDRNPAYLDFLRTYAKCSVSHPVHRTVSLGRCDPAHGPVNGMGSKGPDSGAIPLCRLHHEEQHRLGWPAFEAKYGIDREKEAAAFHALYLIWRESR